MNNELDGIDDLFKIDCIVLKMNKLNKIDDLFKK